MLDYLQKAEEAQNEKSPLREACFYVQLFFVCCIIGWIYEFFFYLITEGTAQNRGFLYGPYLPVYGFGGLAVVLLLKRFRRHPAAVFIFSMLITGVLEYLTGFAMMQLWHKRWWDYTGLFMNLQGYICLRSLVSFAVMCLLLIYLTEPLLRRAVNKLGKGAMLAVSGGCLLCIGVDTVLTLIFRHPVV